MTRKQFYRRLRKVAPEYRWSVDDAGRIRARKRQRGWKRLMLVPPTHFLGCPISVTTNSPLDAGAFAVAAQEVGLAPNDAMTIARAADDIPNHNPRTRAALLRAVGLSE